MFDKTTITKHESKVVAVTKEIEKTISPDKVTEMYDSVREEVESKILRSIHISSNVMDAAALEIEPRYDTRSTDYAIRFNLNGKETIYRGSFSENEMMAENRLFDKAWKVFSDAVSSALVRDTVKIWQTRIIK